MIENASEVVTNVDHPVVTEADQILAFTKAGQWSWRKVGNDYVSSGAILEVRDNEPTLIVSGRRYTCDATDQIYSLLRLSEES